MKLNLFLTWLNCILTVAYARFIAGTKPRSPSLLQNWDRSVLTIKVTDIIMIRSVPHTLIKLFLHIIRHKRRPA
uniref:Secreted protein n=1 Tax=Rhizophora mucronata TaxID=61149 RepID=A0A2P2PFJ3_RHIMU